MNLHHQLGSASPPIVIETAYAALTLIQERTPGEQLAAAGILFVALCDTFGIPEQDVRSVAMRIQADPAMQAQPTYKAFQQYLKNEIKPHASY